MMGSGDTLLWVLGTPYLIIRDIDKCFELSKVSPDPQIPRSGVKYEEIDVNNILNWLPPNENEIISIHKKNEIISNISGALTFMQIQYKFI